MNKDTIRQISVVLAVLATIAINAMANAIPLNGQSTGEISDRFQVFFVPAGYVFSIWGLIYLGMLAYAAYQALPAKAADPHVRSIGYLFVLSSVANITWLFMWHYEYFPITVAAMVSLLVLLIAIYLSLDASRVDPSSRMKWLVQIPFSIYLGWITVATIANITSFLHFIEWNGWGLSPELWTQIMLAVAVFIGAAVILTRGDVAFVAVLIWAFAGIAVKHSDISVVATGAWLAAAITSTMMIVGAVRQRLLRQRFVQIT